ncbi:hypothetical protein SAMN03159341_102454 [Paenibacillus sp. 1_12]|uniref:hypothetical protein n=1 Tax=Paenibacillus sp. 1_12 TaxID=1566278 RepID=UPI0008F03D0E|nr:hypothetical protein [Paenibacillus sp. 1_12]SFK97014.1 hypothetical protein SAMN03159341_102454 [Paenibacillus sp. 1_12]
MSRWKQSVMAGTVAAALLVGGFGSSFTQQVFADDDIEDAWVAGTVDTSIPAAERADLKLNQIIILASSILDIDNSDLQEELHDGKSLADVAMQQTNESANFTSKLVSLVEAPINKSLNDGKITSEEATALLKSTTDEVTHIVNQPGYEEKA